MHRWVAGLDDTRAYVYYVDECAEGKEDSFAPPVSDHEDLHCLGLRERSRAQLLQNAGAVII